MHLLETAGGRGGDDVSDEEEAPDLEEAGRLVEGLHRAVVDGQVARVGVGDDHLQRGGVHVAQVHVGLLALAQTAHEHRPVTEEGGGDEVVTG